MSNRGAIFSGIGLGPAVNHDAMIRVNLAKQQMEMQREENRLQQEQRQKAQAAASASYLANYLDKKDYLTGTNYDPKIVGDLDETMKEGMMLASKGADTPTIMMALAPRVARINEYSTKAKAIDAQIKQSGDKRKGYKGYNIDALNDLARKKAFYNADGTMKDIRDVDPSIDYTTEVINESPELVTSSAGLEEFINKTPKADFSKEVQTMNRGKKVNRMFDVKTPYWEDFSVGKDGMIAVDAQGNPSIDVKSTTITDDNGEEMIDPETKQPYRAVTDEVFKSVMSRSPDTADYIRGEVNRYFKQVGEGKVPPIGSAQWEQMAKVVMYEELKNRSGSSYKERNMETKAPLLTRIELGGGLSSGRGSSQAEVDINDAYEEIAGSPKVMRGDAVMLTDIGGTSPVLVIDEAKKRGYDYDQDEIYVQKDKNGVIQVHERETGKRLFPLDYKGINLKANTTQKPKQEVLKKAKESEGKYKIKGKEYSEKELLDMGYTLDQIKDYKQ